MKESERRPLGPTPERRAPNITSWTSWGRTNLSWVSSLVKYLDHQKDRGVGDSSSTIEVCEGETILLGAEHSAPFIALHKPGGQTVSQGHQVVLSQDVAWVVEHRQFTIFRLTKWILAGKHCSHLREVKDGLKTLPFLRERGSWRPIV